MIKWGPLFAVAMSVFVAVPVMGENSTGHEISRFYGVWTAEANCKSANEQSEGYYFNLDNNYYEHGFGTRCSEVSMWLDGRSLRVSATCQGEEQGLQVKAFEIEPVDNENVKIGNQIFHRCQQKGKREHSVKFQIVNNTHDTVHLAFFEKTYRTQFSPAPGQAYILDGSATRTYEIDCVAGQNICYGASIPGGGVQLFWGLGRDGKQSCSGCCLSCPRSEPLTKTLNTWESRRPN